MFNDSLNQLKIEKKHKKSKSTHSIENNKKNPASTL